MAIKKTITVFFTIAMLIAFIQVFSQNVPDTTKAQASSSVIKSKVIYTARDSIRFDVENQKVFLYGEARVTYEQMKLSAGYIEFDMVRNIAFARGEQDSTGNNLLDSAGMPVGDPVFSDGEKTFEAKELTYNFETKKGKIRDVSTQEGEALIHGEAAKKVYEEGVRNTGDVYYIKNARYTTCDLRHPHFYLRATKIKVIPQNKIITGPAYLVVSDIPTPLALPFGVFPNKTGRKSGVLIPSYGESNLGYFLKDGGYYFGLSDYFDLALRGDIYSKGSYGIKANTKYNKRYRYNGSLGLNYANIKISEKEFPDYQEKNDFFVRWQHLQDPKSNPSSRFMANVNAGSSTYQTYNSNTSNEYLSNTFQSNISWNKSWQGTPYNLSVNGSHNQNTLTKMVNVVFPEAALTRSRWYPFQRKPSVGKQNVFEKIGISPALYAKNQITALDTEILKESSLNKFQNGIKFTSPVSTSFNAGPIIFTSSFGLNAYGYFQIIKKTWNPGSSEVIKDTIRNFAAAYDYNAAFSMSTKYYMTYLYKSKNPGGPAVRAIRHVLTPSASLSYRPDFSREKWGYYHYVQTSVAGDSSLYSMFEGAIYGGPQSGKFGMISFSLHNNIEMKLRPSKKDTAGKERKVVLIENLSVSGGYNFAADSFQWSIINLNAVTRLFKVIDITANGTLDPYKLDYGTGRRTKNLLFSQTHSIGRLTSAMFSASASLRSIEKKTGIKKPVGKAGRRTDMYQDEIAYILSHPDYYVDFNIPWDIALYYNIVYAKPAFNDTVIQSFTFSGNLLVTSKWKVGFRSGFDFVNKDFTYTSFDIYRDLHCWEMRLNWIPFGFRKSYMLTIGVKSSVLQDLKLQRKRDWYDYN